MVSDVRRMAIHEVHQVISVADRVLPIAQFVLVEEQFLRLPHAKRPQDTRRLTVTDSNTHINHALTGINLLQDGLTLSKRPPGKLAVVIKGK